MLRFVFSWCMVRFISSFILMKWKEQCICECFASLTRSPQRNNTTNDGQQYDELRRSENSYNNTELKH